MMGLEYFALQQEEGQGWAGRREETKPHTTSKNHISIQRKLKEIFQLASYLAQG
jgi:hypothetical protein